MQDNGTMTRNIRDHQLTIRIPQRLRDELETEADRDHRSVADIINIMLEQRYPPVPRQPPTAKRVPNPADAIKVGGGRVKITKRSK